MIASSVRAPVVSGVSPEREKGDEALDTVFCTIWSSSLPATLIISEKSQDTQKILDALFRQFLFSARVRSAIAAIGVPRAWVGISCIRCFAM